MAHSTEPLRALTAATVPAKVTPTPITDDAVVVNLASIPAPVLVIPDIEKRGKLTGIASSATALLGNPPWIHMVCGFTFDALPRNDAYRAANGTYTMPVFIKAMGM